MVWFGGEKKKKSSSAMTHGQSFMGVEEGRRFEISPSLEVEIRGGKAVKRWKTSRGWRKSYRERS